MSRNDILHIRDLTVGYAHYSGPKARNPVTVEINIGHTEGEWQTVNHEAIVNPVRFSMVTAIWQTNMNDIYMSTPTADALREIYKFANGWYPERVNRLIALEKYHLNDMKAACAHQAVLWEKDRYGISRPSLDLTLPCPETGYKYGHGWLVEPLPQSVIEEVKELFNV